MKRLIACITALWLACAAPALASQASLVTPGSPLPMSTLASFLNAAFLSLGSCNSGNSAPANGTGGAAFPGECWIDTTANPWVVSLTPDGTHWAPQGTLNTSTYVWTPYFGAPGAAAQLFIGQTSAQPAWETLSGDCTISAGGVTACGSVHGVTWPASGTSGGIPYFSGAGAITSSAALAQYGIVVGGGSGGAPSTIAKCADAQLILGQASAPACATMSGDATLADTGAVTLATVNSNTGSVGGAAAIPVITLDGKGRATAASTVAANPTQVNGNAWPSAGTSGGIPYWSAANTVASSGALAQYGIVYGGGAGAAPAATAAGTDGQMLLGQTGAAAAWKTCGGDCASISAAGAVTNGKLNGVSYGAAPSTDTVPVVTAPNTVTYETAPVGAGGTGATALGSTLSNSGGTLGVVTCTATQLGACAPDGTTITASAGVLTAVGSAATSINAVGASGATTVSNGLPGYGLATVNTSKYLAGNAGAQLFSAAGGYINKFRNGTFDVWQRGTSSLAAGSSAPGNYTADGWMVYQPGAQGTCSRDTGGEGTLYWLGCVGAASNTDTVFRQKIESFTAAPLAGNTVTVQFVYSQSSGNAATPKVSSCYASAQDNFSTCTGDLAATSLTSCASAAGCVEAYTFNVSASATNGYEIVLDCNTALTGSQDCYITAADIRVTPGVTTGVNANPPPPELRPIDAELAQCQRYYTTSYGNGVAPGTSTSAGAVIGFTNQEANNVGVYMLFAAQMRAAPTVSIWDTAGNSGKYSTMTSGGSITTNQGAVSSIFVSGPTGAFVAASTGNGIQYMVIQYAASAEL